MKNMSNIKKLLVLLKKHNITLSSAESFTGGLFGKKITDIPGSSQVYKGGVICYWTEVKEKILLVDKSIIDKFGVVSEEVAFNLALNCKKMFETDVAVSFTGNAGPTKCDEFSNVGDCYIGIDFLGKVEVMSCKLKGKTRISIRNYAIEIVVNKLIELIDGKF